MSLTGGYAVLKDLVGPAQVLLIPTTRVTGIEDPTVLAPDAPNWLADAWSVRHLVGDRLGRPLPDTAVSLAVNAVTGRTQEQMHVHVDCLRPDVAKALARMASHLGASWTALPEPLPDGLSDGRRWVAMRLEGDSLDDVRPLTLLADGLQAHGEMGRWTLVVTGTTVDTHPGLLLLADRADLGRGDRGNGEVLQDHRCALSGR